MLHTLLAFALAAEEHGMSFIYAGGLGVLVLAALIIYATIDDVLRDMRNR